MFRDKGFTGRLFIAPLIQLLLLPMAANLTVKNVNIAVVDNDRSVTSQQMINKVLSSGYFKLTGYTDNSSKSNKLIEKDQADIVLEIPQNFERDLINNNTNKLAIEVNAINGVKASVGFAYLGSILSDFNNQIRANWVQPEIVSASPVIDVVTSFWYNPLLSYYVFMVPGILVSLITGISGLSAAFNIVKEKEIGTIEQINVTPIKKWQFILGKLIPFWVTGIVVFSLGLIVAWVIYGIVPLGNIAILYLFASVYMFAILGFGLLISTYTDTQMQANSLMFLFIMVFNMMSGLFTPYDSMPQWAQFVGHLFPVSYFIQVMRMVVIKGSDLADIFPFIWKVFLIGIVLNTWAVLNYRKTT